MTKDQALKIIDREHIEDYNYQNKKHSANEVGIYSTDQGWIVYATDERASVVTGSEAFFSSEFDAWDNFIDRLRAGMRLKRRHNGHYF